MNESFTLVLMYHVLALNTDWVSDEYVREVVGISFIALIVLDIAINFFLLFRTIWKATEIKLLRK